MMADDTMLIFKDLYSLHKAINIFEQFRHCSRLKLHLNKTETIPKEKILDRKNYFAKKRIKKVSCSKYHFSSFTVRHDWLHKVA